MHIVLTITNIMPMVSHATPAYWSPLKDAGIIFPVAEVLYFLYLKEKVGDVAAWNGIDQEGAVLATKIIPES